MSARYRIVGSWFDGRIFLAVLGLSRHDCLRRLPAAMTPYTLDDLNQIEWLWLERWDAGTSLRPAAWVPVEDIGLRRLKLIRRLGVPRLLTGSAPRQQGHSPPPGSPKREQGHSRVLTPCGVSMPNVPRLP